MNSICKKPLIRGLICDKKYDRCALCLEEESDETKMIKDGCYECCTLCMHKECFEKWKKQTKNIEHCLYCGQYKKCEGCGYRHQVEREKEECIIC